MRHRRITTRRTALAAAGIAALVAGSLTVANANAAEPQPSPQTLTSVAASELASTLTSQLSQDAAGAYYDAGSKQLVVNVVDESAAEAVEKQGAVARVVKHSTTELLAAKESFTKHSVPGTAFSVDPVSNQVVVTVDRTVQGADLAQVREAVDALGDKATLRKSPGEFKPLIAGGDAIYSSGARCSLGFNVTVGGQPAFLTAGHCGQAGSSWSDSSGGTEIGTMQASTFPGEDHALVVYSSATDAPSEVNLYNGSSQEITEAAEATVGMQVQRSGSTTQLHGGTVLGVDVSVTYPEGTVNGLIHTDVCAEPGDSGGALFSDTSAVGITSGGSGDCSSGGETFFQPVTDALAEYGAQIG